MKTIRLALFLLVGVVLHAQPTTAPSSVAVQKINTAGATQNDLTGPVNVTGNSTVTVKLGGTLNGAGTFDFSSGNVTFAAGQIPNAALGNASITISAHPVALGGSLTLAAADVSGLAASATIDTTNAGNITTGTLPAARLPAPTAVALGGVNSKAAALHQFVTGIGTDGSVSQAQPAASDVSGLAASATTDTTNAGNITAGTLPNARLLAVPNTALANSTITISAHAVALGGSLSLAAGDVSGLAPSATTDTTNAGNITAGTLPNARLVSVPNSALANSTITIGTTAISLGGTATTLTGLPDPTQSDNPATKGYVDALLYGLDWKASVRLATTANVALSGLSAIDGVTPVTGDRVLVRAQSTASQNGLYVAAAGAWTRSVDGVDPDVTAGMTVFVNEGTTFGQCAFSLITADPITVGTTALTFAQVSGPNLYTAGTGIGLIGNQISVANVPNTSLANSTVTISGHSLALGGSLNLVPTDAGAEPAITAGTNTQYWRGDKSWRTLNQAAVAGLTTADSPTFAGLTSGPTSITGNATIFGNSGLLAIQYLSDGGPAYLAWKNSSGVELWKIGGGLVSSQDELAIMRGTSAALVFDSSLNGTFSGNIVAGTTSGGVTGTLTLGNGVGGNSALILRGGSTQTAWQVGSNITVGDAFEIAPSTVAGGTAFGAPTFSLTAAGLTINAATPSTLTTNGALVVSGGVGVGGNATVGGAVNLVGTSGVSTNNAQSIFQSTDNSTPALTVRGGDQVPVMTWDSLSVADPNIRNWGLKTNSAAYGDWELWVGASRGASPFGGTKALSFDYQANATLAGNLSVNGTGLSSITGASSGNTGVLKLTGDSWNTGVSLYAKAASGNSSTRNWQISTNYSAQGTLEFLHSSAQDGIPDQTAMSLDGSGNLTVNGTGTSTFAGSLRAQGNTAPASGAGVEMQYDSTGGNGYVLAYDRTASAYKTLYLNGTVNVVNSQGLNVTNTTAATNTSSGALVVGSNIGLSGNAGGTSYFGGNVYVPFAGDAGAVSFGSSSPAFSSAVTTGAYIYNSGTGHTALHLSNASLGALGSEGFEILELNNGAVSITNLQNSTLTLGTNSAAVVTLNGTSTSLAGKLNGAASTTSAASLNIPHGTAPTSPADGDVWTTTSGMYVRVNGTTVGPLGSGGGSSMMSLPIVTLYGSTDTWSSMPAAVTFYKAAAGYAGERLVPLGGFTQVRLVVNKRSTAGVAGSKLILKYYTAWSNTVGDFLDIGTSEVSVPIDSGNGILDSGWINLATGAKADVVVVLTGSGGDGATSPTFGDIIAYFK